MAWIVGGAGIARLAQPKRTERKSGQGFSLMICVRLRDKTKKGEHK
jgi:hypothetical protein